MKTAYEIKQTQEKLFKQLMETDEIKTAVSKALSYLELKIDEQLEINRTRTNYCIVWNNLFKDTNINFGSFGSKKEAVQEVIISTFKNKGFEVSNVDKGNETLVEWGNAKK